MPTEANAVLSDEQIAEIEARAYVATPGPFDVLPVTTLAGDTAGFKWGRPTPVEFDSAFWDSELVSFEDATFYAHAREDIPALCQTVKALRAERMEIQRALASSVLNDPTEDDNPPYSTREIVGGITGLIDRKASLLTQCVALKARLSEVERERDRFAALADQRHDQLWEARRQRDDLAARCAPYLENLK